MTIITRSDDLEILLAVVDSGGFSAAAALLDIQVAKVSRSINRLEQQLSTTLLNRTTRRVELTEEGQRFVQQIREGLTLLSTAEEQIKQSQQTPSGRLRVDTPSSFVLHQIVPHISAFKAAYPRIDLELSADDNIIDLLEKRTDIAIRIGKLEDSTLTARLLGHSRLHIVATTNYLQQQGRPETPAELNQHQCLGFLSPSTLNIWPVGSGITIKPYIAASNGEILRQLCLSHNGIACLSYFMIKDDLDSGRLQPILNDYIQSPHPREIVQAVYYRNSALSNRIKVFLDFIQPRLVL